MAFDVSFAYRIVDKYSATINRINARTARMRKTVRSVNTALLGMGKRLGSVVRAAGRFSGIGGLITGALAVVSINKFTEAMGNATEASLNFVNQSQALDMSTGFIQRFVDAGEEVNLGAEQMQDLLQEFNVRMGEAGTASAGPLFDLFDDMGKLPELKEIFLLDDADARVKAILDNIAAMPDRMQTFALEEVFGGEAARLEPLLDDINAAMSSIDREGGVIPEETLQQLAALKKTTDDATGALSRTFTLLLGKLAPAISQIAERFRAFMVQVQGSGHLDDFIERVSAFLGSVDFNRISDSLASVYNWVVQIDFAKIVSGVRQAWTVASDLAAVISDVAGWVNEVVQSTVGWKAVIIALGTAWAAANLVAGILALANPIGATIAGIALVGAAITALAMNWDAVKSAAGAAWDWIGNAASGVLSMIKDGFLNAFNSIGEGLVSLVRNSFVGDLLGGAAGVLDNFVTPSAQAFPQVSPSSNDNRMSGNISVTATQGTEVNSAQFSANDAPLGANIASVGRR